MLFKVIQPIIKKKLCTFLSFENNLKLRMHERQNKQMLRGAMGAIQRSKEMKTIA